MKLCPGRAGAYRPGIVPSQSVPPRPPWNRLLNVKPVKTVASGDAAPTSSRADASPANSTASLMQRCSRARVRRGQAQFASGAMCAIEEARRGWGALAMQNDQASDTEAEND